MNRNSHSHPFNRPSRRRWPTFEYQYPLWHITYNDHFTEGPGYITPDGKFINLLENGFCSHINFDHKKRAIRSATNDLNFIRVNDRLPLEVLVELPINGVTDEQWVSLERFFNTLLDKGITFCEVGIEPNGSKILRWTDNVAFYEKFDLLETKPYIIIQRLKSFYHNKKTE